MRGLLPRGAEEIAKLRESGKRPEDQVVVSLCGELQDFPNPQVFVSCQEHDWRFLGGLPVIICVNQEWLSDDVQRTAMALARVAYYRMAVWNVDTHRGLTVWPVWRALAGNETHWTFPEHLCDAEFVRWAKVTWSAGENARFMTCE